MNKELYLADTGTYYWRVHWLVNPLDSASAPYETSQVERFRIMGTPAADTTRAACMADCDAAPIADRNPSNALQPGDIVKVGKFDMTVQTVQYSGPEASGMGLIPVPFMNTTVKVQYTNIKVNAQKEMFFGNVAARQDTIGFMPNIPGLGQLQVTNREELFEYVKRDRYSSVFDPSVPMGLPFGIDKVVDGDRYMIAIVGMSFTHERATMSAAVSFPLPFLPKRSSDNKQQQLGLGASSICFHPDGLAGLGIGALFLFDPIEFDYAPGQYIKFMNSNMDPITGMVADSGTYVSWDCDGFRALHVKGEISFSNELLTRPVVRYKSKAEELRNRPLGNRDVKARFKLNVRRSGNWLAMLDMDPFSINGIEDWNFVVKEATLDFSDLENPPNMVFPENYSGDRSILWNGFHLKRVQVGLPEDLRLRFPSNEELEDPTGKDSVLVDRIVVNLTDLLIDRTGISGKIFALNLIDLKDGDLNGWSFSIDTLSLEFVSNSFTRGGFNGNILTPLTPDQFKYRTLLSQSSDSSGLRFSFNVLPVDTITVPLWAATMNILPTSRITIEADTGGFKPQLILNGSIDIMQKIGEVDVRFAGVRFQELKLQTMEPMLSCSSFTFSSPQKLMAGFPVSVSNIQLTSQNYHGLFSWDDTPGPRQALQFTVSVNFTGEENTFGGSTTLAILGRFDMGDLLMGGEEYPSLKLTGIDLKTINIQGDLGFVKIKGFINFYAEDSLYGQGFVGGIDATFIQCINVAVIGCFGEVNDMRYWYVDAMAKFNPGINLSVPSVPPVPIPVDLYGFGGGAFYKMSLQEPPPPDAPISTKTLDGTPTPGTTLSNLRLVPNPDAFFGLMATVVLGSTGGGQAFNCDLTMAVTINNNGGINQIGFSGSGYFMSSVFERDFTAVRADASLIMDMPSRTLTGNLTVMINVPLVLQGRQPNNIAGSAHLYMGPDHWKILVGQPEPEASRVGVRIVDAFDANAYLMAGQQLPPPAQLPSAVTNALGNITPPRSPKISNGTGFAFGASLTPPKFEDTYLMFNAKLDATVGFDLNMYDYGATRCDNMKPGEKLGINGWYANGQIWGHFIGSIGISIDLWGEPINQEILSVNAAALLTAGFPNPAWFKGAVGGNYNIMGGLVSGYCNFKLSYGNSCAPPQESPMAGVKIIADLSPNAGETNVDCGIYPNAVFNVDINRNYSFEEILSDGTKRQRTFRFEIESFTIKRGSSILSRTISTSNDGSQSCIMPNDLLTGNNSHSVSITVVCKERINNIWKIAKRNNNSEIRETVSRNFTTGPRPDHVRPQDVTYSYPLHNQKHYAYNHCEKGQVRLKQGRSDLFSEAPPAGYTRSYIAYFIPTNGGTRLEGSVSFADQFRTILFNMPNLSPSTLYKVEIVRKDRIATLAGFENLNNFQAVSNTGFQSFANVFANLADGNSTLRSRSLSASQMRSTGEHLLYSFHFKTSQYATLDAKITALNVTNNQRMYEGSNERVDLTLQGPERLDIHEVFGYEYINGNTLYLFKFMHIEDQYSSTWHTSYLNTDIYDLYNRIVNNNYSTMRIFRSNPDYKGGIPPKRVYMAMSLAQPLSNQDIDPSSGGSGPILSGSGISFAIPSQPTSIISITTSEDARADYNRLRSIVTDMRTRLGNNLSGVDATTRTKANNLMSTPFKNIFAGTSHNIRFFTPSSISRCNPQNTMSRTKTFSIPSNQPVYQISTSTVTFFN